MKRNSFTLLLSLFWLAASSSYAEDLPLNCEAGEVPAFVITYDHYVTRLIDKQPDRQARQVVTATAETRYYAETGQMLEAAARERGETLYTPYQKERWETADAVYTYLSTGDIARVRRHPLIDISQTPYALPAKHETLKTIAGYQCDWHEEDIVGVQTTQRCEAVFYGWVTPLYSRKMAEGRDVLLSEATDIHQRCIKKESLYVPQDKPWKFSE
ncbi:hypothetical protein EH243_04915 [Amphritea opalescens]|uniref:Uncharacterized protein n=1 Tax=Amphritea opalescens TaxID=2490544 RepID=A0A430KTU1_9GAMM|nr:hypothetical protein [Amphritea opalescens]RTE66941.1 hypothetical protein EH243_04915 [Amphritea opalescens]